MDGERLKLNDLLFGCLGVLARLAAEPCCALRHVLLVPFRSFEICRLIMRPSPGREEAGRRETSSRADGQTGKGQPVAYYAADNDPVGSSIMSTTACSCAGRVGRAGCDRWSSKAVKLNPRSCLSCSYLLNSAGPTLVPAFERFYCARVLSLSFVFPHASLLRTACPDRSIRWSKAGPL